MVTLFGKTGYCFVTQESSKSSHSSSSWSPPFCDASLSVCAFNLVWKRGFRLRSVNIVKEAEFATLWMFVERSTKLVRWNGFLGETCCEQIGYNQKQPVFYSMCWCISYIDLCRDWTVETKPKCAFATNKVPNKVYPFWAGFINDWISSVLIFFSTKEPYPFSRWRWWIVDAAFDINVSLENLCHRCNDLLQYISQNCTLVLLLYQNTYYTVLT